MALSRKSVSHQFSDIFELLTGPPKRDTMSCNFKEKIASISVLRCSPHLSQTMVQQNILLAYAWIKIHIQKILEACVALSLVLQT